MAKENKRKLVDLRYLVLYDTYLATCERLDINWSDLAIKRIKIGPRKADTYARIVAIYAPNLTFRALAMELGLTAAAVGGCINHLIEAGWLPEKVTRSSIMERAKEAHRLQKKIRNSHRQQSVAELLLRCRSGKEIADEIGLAHSTVCSIIRQIVSTELFGVGCREAGRILKRTNIAVVVHREGIPYVRAGKRVILTNEGFAELMFLLGTEERRCPTCEKFFKPKRSNSTACSKKCARVRWSEGSRPYFPEKADPARLQGWRKVLYEVLESQPESTKNRWVRHAEAVRISKLTAMQLIYLAQSGIIKVKFDLDRVVVKRGGRTAPTRFYLERELQLARKVYKQYAARS